MRTKIHKITTMLLAVGLLLGQFSQTFAQDKEPEKLVLLKLYPIPLATSSMAFGAEMFNKEKTRSTNVILGIRYSNEEMSSSATIDGKNESITNFSKWSGLTGQIERRMYVPSFTRLEKGTWLDNYGSLGVYWAPTLKMDYSMNDFDKSFFDYSRTNASTFGPSILTNRGKVSYIGVTPSINIGLQFTMFQYLYLDFSIGAGIRLLDTNVITKEQSGGNAGQYTSYYGLGNAIDNVIQRDGVQVTGGISIGVKW